MPVDLRCPRCLRPARPPGLRTSRWTCDLHGPVAPLHPARPAQDGQVSAVTDRAQVPVWLPWPLPSGWVVTGIQAAGDDHSGALAAVTACSGPNPLRGMGSGHGLTADLLVVAEQPGVGLGALLAGLDDVDPGPALADVMQTAGPHATAHAAGHAVPLWSVPAAPDRAVYVGEAASVWLWLVVLPEQVGALALDALRLVDLRYPGHPLDLPAGALTPHLP